MKKLIYFIVFVFLLFFCFLFIHGYEQVVVRKETKKILSSLDFECPAGTASRISLWGFSGYSRYCIDANGKFQGKWVAWENKITAIEGAYSNGKENGLWIWYDKEGEIHKTVIFDNGNQISETIHNDYQW